MAVGPIHIAGIAGFRSVAPLAYANPFNGGLLSWVGDPTNTWDTMSYVVVVLMLGSTVYLINGAITFFEVRTKTAILTTPLFFLCLVVLSEGGRLDPTDYKHVITAMIAGLAFFSTCGAVFAMSDAKDKK